MTSISTNKRLEQIKDHIIGRSHSHHVPWYLSFILLKNPHKACLQFSVTGSSSRKEHLVHHRHPDDVVIVSYIPKNSKNQLVQEHHNHD